jgi:hypothetical protein
MVVAQSSYAVLSLSGGILSLILIPVIIWAYRSTGENKVKVGQGL